nr:Rpn family recombination-promoting nuclease/putative transposase [Clostridium luticellarii]
MKNTSKGDRRRKDFKLPAIVPMVLYNGKNRWTAYRNFRDVLCGSELFGENIIDFRYILFDIYRYDESQLESMTNMVSTIFLLDKEISKEDLMKRLRLTAYVLKKITPEQFDILKIWIRSIMKPRLDDESKVKVEEILEKSSQGEVDSMVSNLGKTIDNIIKEGRKEGEKEGKKAGLLQGLEKLLDIKFSDISYMSRIERIEDENTLNSVFEDAVKSNSIEEFREKLRKRKLN